MRSLVESNPIMKGRLEPRETLTRLWRPDMSVPMQSGNKQKQEASSQREKSGFKPRPEASSHRGKSGVKPRQSKEEIMQNPRQCLKTSQRG